MKLNRFYTVLLIALAVNIPGLIEFDSSGLTRDQGLNVQSLLRTMLAAAVTLLTMWGISRQTKGYGWKSVVRRTSVYWLLLVIFAASCFQAGKISVALFRLYEWILASSILLLTARCTPAEERTALLIQMIKAISFATVALVLIGVFIAPNLAFGSVKAEGAQLAWRLGGFLVHPNRLGILAGMGAWYALLFFRGTRRWCFFLGFLAVMALTVSRSAITGFVCCVPVLGLLGTRRIRRTLVAGTLLAVPAVALFWDTLISFLARGQNAEDIASASGRAGVWTTGVALLLRRPLTGYGFIEGVRESLPQGFAEVWWAPQNAHNDLLQGLLSAGVLAGALLTVFYIQLFRRVRGLPPSKEKVFLALIATQLFIYSLQSPLVAGELSGVGVMIIAMYVLLAPATRPLPARGAIQERTCEQSVHC